MSEKPLDYKKEYKDWTELYDQNEQKERPGAGGRIFRLCCSTPIREKANQRI